MVYNLYIHVHVSNIMQNLVFFNVIHCFIIVYMYIYHMYIFQRQFFWQLKDYFSYMYMYLFQFIDDINFCIVIITLGNYTVA